MDQTEQSKRLDTLHLVATNHFLNALKADQSSAVQKLSTWIGWHEPDDWLRWLGWDDPEKQDDIRKTLGFDPAKHGMTGDNLPGDRWRGIQRRCGLCMSFAIVQFMIEALKVCGDPSASHTLKQLEKQLGNRFRVCSFTLNELGKIATFDDATNVQLAAQMNEKILIDCTLGMLRQVSIERSALVVEMPQSWFALLARMSLMAAQ